MTTRGETYQGTPCKRGHSGKRYAKGGACTECQRITDTNRRERLKARRVAVEQQQAQGQPT